MATVLLPVALIVLAFVAVTVYTREPSPLASARSAPPPEHAAKGGQDTRPDTVRPSDVR